MSWRGPGFSFGSNEVISEHFFLFCAKPSAAEGDNKHTVLSKEVYLKETVHIRLAVRLAILYIHFTVPRSS